MASNYANRYAGNRGAIVLNLDFHQIRGLNFAFNVLSSRQEQDRLMYEALRNSIKIISYALRRESNSRVNYGWSIMRNPQYQSFGRAVRGTARYVNRAAGGRVLVMKVGLIPTEQTNPNFGRMTGPTMFHSLVARRRILKPHKYWHLVNLGTKAHYQPRLNYMHPGARPQPIRNDTVQNSRARFEQSVLRGIVRYIRRDYPFRALFAGLR